MNRITKIGDPAEINKDENIYVLDVSGSRKYDDSVRDYGKENVIHIPELGFKGAEEKGLVRIMVYGRDNLTSKDSPVKFIL